MSQAHIRNFCIVAHIDHGKSTLADRILEITGAVRGEAREQMLDTMELERERGITIKMTAVRLDYKAEDGKLYEFNLIDTPGHVDFTYEVSRSLQACEGALLVVDATQGVEAQTIANASMAMNQGLEIVPVINKIDLPHADVARAKEEIEGALALDASNALLVSAKTGEGVQELLEAVVRLVPPPKETGSDKLRALIFDSHFDTYQGTVAYVRIFEGSLRKGDKIKMMSTCSSFEVDEVGFFTPEQVRGDELNPGETGYFTAAMK
ncbi:MAG: GTP-binding protein, partial [Armatimonadetes bacterium]|nr:GTP-binding protein [Armatimonadota bacterium]